MAARGASNRISALAALLFQGGIGVLGLLAIWLFDIPVRWVGIGEGWVWLFGAIGAVLTYILLLVLTRIPALFPDDMTRQMRGLYQFARSFSWPVLIALSVLAGVGEELLFRGAVQGWLANLTGSWPAIFASALLFGLVHYVSFTYFLVATGLGLLLGFAYHISGSLELVMIWHALYDMVALFILVRFPHWFGVESPASV